MRKRLGETLIVIGFLLLTYWFAHTWLHARAMQAPSAPPEISQVQLRPAQIVFPNQTVFGLKPAEVAKGHWTVWPDAVTYIPTDSPNLVVYAHNTKKLFGNLGKIKVGEKINIKMNDGTTQKYTVTEVVVIDPGKIEWLQPTHEPVLTLYTCTGILDSKRLVVRAEL